MEQVIDEDFPLDYEKLLFLPRSVVSANEYGIFSEFLMEPTKLSSD